LPGVLSSSIIAENLVMDDFPIPQMTKQPQSIPLPIAGD
jgi:ABC-type spermidine/putrescine transport system permease subunit II